MSLAAQRSVAASPEEPVEGEVGEEVCYIVDDDAAVRESLEFLISSGGVAVAGFDTPAEFLEVIGAESRGCVLLDLRLPGMSGFEVLAAMKRRGVGLPVIMISGHGDIPAAVRAMRGGAIDFVPKGQASDDSLLQRVRDAMIRDRHRGRGDRQREEALRRYERLTPREREVMARVVAGAMNKEVAADLGLRDKTIEAHRKHVMEKMEAGSLAELVRLAVAMEE